MVKALLVGCGGFIGSIARYLVGGAVHRAVGGPVFPYGTAFINVTGCLLIGLLAGLDEARGILSPETRVFLLIGVLGGYTTFSTFGYETWQLLRDGEMLAGGGNVALQIVAGLFGVWAGQAMGRWL